MDFPVQWKCGQPDTESVCILHRDEFDKYLHTHTTFFFRLPFVKQIRQNRSGSACLYLANQRQEELDSSVLLEAFTDFIHPLVVNVADEHQSVLQCRLIIKLDHRKQTFNTQARFHQERFDLCPLSKSEDVSLNRHCAKLQNPLTPQGNFIAIIGQ